MCFYKIYSNIEKKKEETIVLNEIIEYTLNNSFFNAIYAQL